jgi:hypothetical protein
MRKMKFYRYPHPSNVGDTLTPFILNHFVKDVDFSQVREAESGKLIAVGSIMRVIKPGDTIWGSGVMRETDQFPQAKDCTFLAVRGKLSRDILIRDGGKVPAVYGDPAILLPLMYNPKIERTHKVGIIPHFVDTHLITKQFGNKLAGHSDWKIIDVFLPYEEFINEVLSCEKVISSSLHGLIIAEAYGLEAEWVVLSEKVIGNGFKFRDYLTGTNRDPQGPGLFPKLDMKLLTKLQNNLLKALEKI